MFGSPAIADGRVVFFTNREMICLGHDSNSPSVARSGDRPQQARPQESPADPNAAPAFVQVRPAEVLLKPGETVHFQAIGYDALGRQLKSLKAEWSYSNPAGAVLSTVTGDGDFHAAARPAGSIGELTARIGKLSGSARVRIVPELPIVEDFESAQDGGLPGWWVGVSKLKYAVENVDGSHVLKKVADERGPIFNRSHVFITPPLKPGYTVQADVMGAQQGGRRGDVGVINDRYTLEMFGDLQRLRVVSWIPTPRFEKRIDFPWQPGQWYTMKLRVDLEENEAHLHAKVWPRGQCGADLVDDRSGRSAAQSRRFRGPLRQFNGIGLFRQRSHLARRRCPDDPRRQHTAKSRTEMTIATAIQ